MASAVHFKSKDSYNEMSNTVTTIEVRNKKGASGGPCTGFIHFSLNCDFFLLTNFILVNGAIQLAKIYVKKSYDSKVNVKISMRDLKLILNNTDNFRNTRDGEITL